MGYQPENLYKTFVVNALVLVYLVRRQIQMKPTRVQSYVFMFTEMYHVVLFMSYTYIKKEQHVL